MVGFYIPPINFWCFSWGMVGLSPRNPRFSLVKKPSSDGWTWQVEFESHRQITKVLQSHRAEQVIITTSDACLGFFNEILALNRKDLGNLSLSRPKHVVRPPSPGIPWVLDSGNHQMAELFRLVKYDHLPRYTFQQWGYRLGIVFMKWDYLQTVYIYI